MNEKLRIFKDTSTRFHRELDFDRLQAWYDMLKPTEKLLQSAPEDIRVESRCE